MLKLVNPEVFALPRGGGPWRPKWPASDRAPLVLLKVRRTGAPGQREVAVAAVVDGEVDHLVCPSQPGCFHAVCAHYRDFHQIEGDEVIALLDAAGREFEKRPSPRRQEK